MLFLLVAALLFLSFGRKDSLGSAAMEEKQPCLITINETENMRWIVENSLTGFEADDWNPNGQWLSDYDSVQAWDSSELERLLPRMVKVTGGTYTMTGKSFKSMSRKNDVMWTPALGRLFVKKIFHTKIRICDIMSL